MSDEQPAEGEQYEGRPEGDEAPKTADAELPVPTGPGAAAAALLKRGPRGTRFENVNDALAYATACFRSGMLPDHIKSPAQAFVIMDNGAELGLRPHASWKTIYITKQGRIATMSKGALAVVQACANFEDYSEEIELEGTEEMRAVAIAKRKGRKPTIKTFSMADAAAANLLSQKKNRRGEKYDGPWQSFVKDMLLARARDRALSIAFAAELAGIELETMAEDADAIDAARAGAPQDQTVQLPAGDLDLGDGPPKQLPAGKPDPLLLHTLGQTRVPQPEAARPLPPEPRQAVQEALAERADSSAKALARETDEALTRSKRSRKKKPRVEVGDIIHGTRRVLQVDEDGRPEVVEKLTKDEIAALNETPEKPPQEAGSPPAPPPAGDAKTCPRDHCGVPLNMLGDCDACGWPNSNFMKGT